MTTSGIIALIGCLGGVIGVIIGVIGYFTGQKKQSNDEVAQRAHFEGEVTAKLKQVIDAIEKLDAKISKNTEELFDEIDKRIEKHEKRYHNV